jgi:Mrp family chromosome partitioning ATPase
VVPDAFPLLHEVDGVIAVARLRVTTTDEGTRLREQTTRAEAPVLGVVVNGIKAKRGNRYGYGYYAAADDRVKQSAPATGS